MRFSRFLMYFNELKVVLKNSDIHQLNRFKTYDGVFVASAYVLLVDKTTLIL